MQFWRWPFQRRAEVKEPLVKYCECGALVWEVQAAYQLPDYRSQVLCISCGRDHSRTPPKAWVQAYRKKRMERFYYLFGKDETRRRIKAGELSLLDYRIKRDHPSVQLGMVGDTLT